MSKRSRLNSDEDGNEEEGGREPLGSPKKKAKKVDGVIKKKKTLDWSSAKSSQFLLKLSYLGTEYAGLAYQKNSDVVTIEGTIMNAMKRACLIESRRTSNFSRCGRTDKGVHAAGNYVSARLRLKKGEGDYDYCTILNAILPHDIRVIGCKKVSDYFDARFQCLYRVYKYFFMADNLDVPLMERTAQKFLGLHDFRNFCKMDIGRVRHFRRRILWIKFKNVGPHFVEVEIAGISFLWHQIRCMMAILLLVGQRLESPSIIDTLLDVVKTPRKPAYELASDTSLILFDCYFEGLHFDRSAETLTQTVALQKLYLEHLTQSIVLRCLSWNDSGNSLEVLAKTAAIVPSRVPPNAKKAYRKLLHRPMGDTVQEREQRYLDSGKASKGRLPPSSDSDEC